MTHLMPSDTRTRAAGNLDTTQQNRLNAVGEKIEELNAAIALAVDAGLTVEVTRSRRYHVEKQGWGDQLAPRITGKSLHA